MKTICVVLDRETLEMAAAQAAKWYMTVGEYLRYLIVKDIKK